MDLELKQFEEELERLAPAGLPEGLISRMESAMAGWQEAEPAGDEKVVPFPKVEVESQGGFSRGFWSAAAAVALLGAVVALVLPNQTAEKNVAASDAAPEFAAVSFAPTNLDRNIIQAADGGVVFTADERPHRLVRVEYVDRIKFRNAAGEELHVEKPSVNFVLIPVETD
jgi:hypothetical protein